MILFNLSALSKADLGNVDKSKESGHGGLGFLCLIKYLHPLNNRIYFQKPNPDKPERIATRHQDTKNKCLFYLN